MEPRYSVLYYKANLREEKNKIDNYLKNGIKVFWFGLIEDINYLKESNGEFSKAFFLQTFNIEELDGADEYDKSIIIDGVGIDTTYANLFNWLESDIPAFNAAQYRVEHCNESTNIVVKASAGTGKTTVMIDRILYLMHTVPNLSMADIYMITFTNEAANQMNDRLQEMLLKKYSLTKEQKYLTWLEQQSQMHISTIDSLAYDLFRRFGTGVGFGRDLAIRQLEKERKDTIKDILSDNLDGKKSIQNQIGMTYSEACRLIDNYWKEITRKGYTISEILEKDWGKCEQEPILSNIQKVMKEVLSEFEEKYRQLKLEENAISINDLFFDFGHFLLDERIDCTGIDLKYLFVDEFQDTDATQIKTFARLVQSIDAKLFAVGDIKQSIYGFKGATDKAFDILESEMKGKLRYFSLRNNYRTCANIMRSMEKYFYQWTKEGLLSYEESVRPFNREEGRIYMWNVNSNNELPTQTLDVIDLSLKELEYDIRSGRKKETSKSKVAVLVRGNNKALEIANLCRASGKTVVLSSDRPFYLSQAVRDFYALISSYIFPGNNVYTFNYLMTPYAKFAGKLDVRDMEAYLKASEEVSEYLNSFMSQTTWLKYQREFRLKPVMSVVKDIIANENVIDNYIAYDKVHMYGDEWTEAKKNKQALIDAKQYQKNLDKLMEILQQRMEGEFATLYDLYVFLSLMIATNREEMEPDIDMIDDYSSVYIMTVHKSKGLEFDTVVMPAMNSGLLPREDTTILSDEKHVGWIYKRSPQEVMKSPNYEVLRAKEVNRIVAEETRLLYVAMTRAVNKLVMLVNDWDYDSWSSLIRKVGLINE